MVYNDEFNFCKPYLTDGEEILWEGKPGKGNILNQGDAIMIPFSIFWCGFAVFGMVMVIKGGIPLLALFGLPFVCIGLYLVFGRFIALIYNRKRSLYVITNKKIIRSCGRKVDMLDGRAILSMSAVEHKNGNGTIRFHQNIGYSEIRRGNSSGYNGSRMFVLDNIPDFDKALQAIAKIEKNFV